jgi:RHS repeat-associated protein
MPGRKFSSASGYRYGFNGKENDKDAGEGMQDYGMRIYDSRLGKFLSVDPLNNKFPFYSPYHFAGCNPIRNIDLDGGEPLDYTSKWKYISMINIYGDRGTELQGFYDPSDANHYMTVKKVYDNVTERTWFIHRSPSGNYQYWKSQEDRIYVHSLGNTTESNGNWASFKTADRINYEQNVALANGISKVVFGAAVCLSTLPALPTLIAGTGGERIAAGVSDGVSQYVSIAASKPNQSISDNLGDINYVSVITNTVMPNADILASVISNGASATLNDGYNGLGSPKVNDNKILFNIVAGAVGNKVSSGLDNSISKYIARGAETPLVSKLSTEIIGNTLSTVASAAAGTLDTNK